MDIKDLQKACSILGIDYLQFEESPEIEKGVGNVDYKALYEEQKALNENFLIQRIMEKKNQKKHIYVVVNGDDQLRIYDI